MNLEGNAQVLQALKGKVRGIPAIDNTLTKEGWCADAKATGDAIKAVEMAANVVSKSGDTMTGELKMSGNRIKYVGAPAEDADAATKGYVDTSIGETKGYVDTSVAEAKNYVDASKTDAVTLTKRVGNPHNLLDNSDFRNPVNQKNQAIYTGVGYTVDRWYLWSDKDGTATISADGVMLERNDSGSMTFGQRFPLNFLLADHYTLAYCDFNNVVHIESCEVKRDNGGEPTDYDRVEIEVTEDIGIKWAALYEGAYTAETLPDYQPKGYGVELAECHRYMFYAKMPYFYGFVTIDAANMEINFPVPTTMRCNPVVGDLNLSVRAKEGAVTVTGAPSVTRTYGGCIMVVVPTGGKLAASQPIAGYSPTDILFDANL